MNSAKQFGLGLNCIKLGKNHYSFPDNPLVAGSQHAVGPLNLSTLVNQSVRNFAFTSSDETRPAAIGSRTFDVPATTCSTTNLNNQALPLPTQLAIC
jgi:hypothetical protein